MDPFQAFAETQAKLQKENEEQDPAIWLPGGDELDQEPTLPEAETRFSTDLHLRGSTQLSVRLRALAYERLRRAADLYGVRPTTLARMMIIRGVNAIIDADLQKRGSLLSGDPDY